MTRLFLSIALVLILSMSIATPGSSGSSHFENFKARCEAHLENAATCIASHPTIIKVKVKRSSNCQRVNLVMFRNQQ